LNKLSIKLRYFANVREATKKDAEIVILPKKTNLKKLMKLLSEKYPTNLKNYMFDETGNPINFLSYFINGRNIHTLQGFHTIIKDGDLITIVPSILGG
jgi:MoaD family protein